MKVKGNESDDTYSGGGDSDSSSLAVSTFIALLAVFIRHWKNRRERKKIEKQREGKKEEKD